MDDDAGAVTPASVRMIAGLSWPGGGKRLTFLKVSA